MKMTYFKKIMGPIDPSHRSGTIQPEHIRRAAMNEYAELQIFKLKFLIVLVAFVILLRYFH